MPCWLTDV
ncbi:hypothetical protein ECFDA507_1303, partial [Escherichia coli FDA507]